MPPQIHVRETKGVTIVDVDGEAPVGDETLRDLLDELLATRKNRIVLNMADVTFLGDSVLAWIISAWVKAKKQDGQIKLASPSKHVENFVRASRLETLLQIYETEEVAILSFDSNNP
jgi:anti-anti-sigma factor